MVFLVILASCKGDEPSIPPVDESRTVLVYMVADNNLSSHGVDDIAEMTLAAQAGDLGDGRLLVYCDTYGSSPRLFEIKPDGTQYTIKDYNDDEYSVSASRMSQVIADAKTYSPSTAYGLILWGHGTGWLQDGIAEPELDAYSYGGERNRHWMNVTTMARVLDGEQFDWVWFDCCYMMSVEALYELRNVADYFVGSVTELPSEGMPYDKTLKWLMPYDSSLLSAAEETFDHFDAQLGEDRTCTMSVVKSAGLDNVAVKTAELYAAFGGKLPHVTGVQRYMLESKCYHYDLAHYVSMLAHCGQVPQYSDASYAALRRAIAECVIFDRATPFIWDILPVTTHSGLSTFIVESREDAAVKNYSQLQWWHDVVEPNVN